MSATEAEERSGPAPRRKGQSQVFYALALAVLIGFVAYVGRGVIIPVVVAGFLSFLIFTLKQTIRTGPLIGRFLPDWLCYLLAFAAIISALLFFLDIVRGNIETLIAAAPEYEARLRSLTSEAIAYLRGLGLFPDDFIGGVDELRRTAIGFINPALSEIGAAVRSLTGNLLTIFLYTVFMLIERGRLFSKIESLGATTGGRAAVRDTIADIGAMVRQYITVKTIINLTTATVSYFILKLIGVDFAGFFALLIFLLNFIPIIGPIIANAFPVVLALVQPGGGLQMALVTAAALIALEQSMSVLVEPRLVGRSLNLSPLIILISLAVWGSLWGFAGALLAVPMTVTVMIILTQFHSTRPLAILLSDTGQIAPIKRQAAAKTA